LVQLVPMTEDEFQPFLQHDIQEYALERTLAGFWSEPEAMDESRKAHLELLPDGLRTADHYLYTIRESNSGEAVGVIWMRASMNSPRPSGFILDLEIDAPFRRKGYARQAMLELEEIARQMGLRQLGLHVFAHNDGARALYENLGYSVASVNMLKPLDAGHL
jgi:ribosomal protein S18 acetylase RimI-like enzyme